MAKRQPFISWKHEPSKSSLEAHVGGVAPGASDAVERRIWHLSGPIVLGTGRVSRDSILEGESCCWSAREGEQNEEIDIWHP